VCGAGRNLSSPDAAKLLIVSMESQCTKRKASKVKAAPMVITYFQQVLLSADIQEQICIKNYKKLQLVFPLSRAVIGTSALSMWANDRFLSNISSPVVRNWTSILPIASPSQVLSIFPLKKFMWLKLPTNDLVAQIPMHKYKKYEKAMQHNSSKSQQLCYNGL
jgi:hypothetical protein